MKNIIKNLLLALSGVCVVVIVVFLISLIVINNGEEPVRPDAVISTPEADPTPEGEQPPYGDETPDTGHIENPMPPATPHGTRYEFTVDLENNTKLIVYAEEELFQFIENDDDWTFAHVGSGDASLEIYLVAMTSQGMAKDAENYLNRYLEENIAEFKGTQMIRNSSLSGVHAQAQRNGITYELWLCRIPNIEMALGFLIHYSSDNHRDNLYDVIDSMSIA